MTLLVWEDALDIGVKAMNDEHIELIRLMNEVYDLDRSKKDKTTTMDALNELKDYVVKHFDDEEKYMERIEYPELKTHKIVHKKLLSDFGKHVQSFIDSEKSSLEDSFYDFLRMWLIGHIKGIDKKYGKYAAER